MILDMLMRMTPRRFILGCLATGGALILIGLLAGCGSKGVTPGARASSARASASAQASQFAHNDKVRKDEARELVKMESCTSHATGGSLTFTVLNGTTGQALIPGAPAPLHPSVQVTHFGFGMIHYLRHPILLTDSVINCAAPRSVRAAAKACVKKLPIPASHAAIEEYLVQVAGCITGAPQ